MVHTLLMWEMTPDSMPEGTVMVAGEALSINEMAQHRKEVTECLADLSMDVALVYPIPWHPAMRSNAGFIELVSLL